MEREGLKNGQTLYLKEKAKMSVLLKRLGVSGWARENGSILRTL